MDVMALKVISYDVTLDSYCNSETLPPSCPHFESVVQLEFESEVS
jgi:hypothetical protein